MKRMSWIIALSLIVLPVMSVASRGDDEEDNGAPREQKMTNALSAFQKALVNGDIPEGWAQGVLMTFGMDRRVRTFFEKPGSDRLTLGSDDANAVLKDREALKVIEFAWVWSGVAREAFDTVPRDTKDWSARIVFFLLWRGNSGVSELTGLVRTMDDRTGTVEQYKYKYSFNDGRVVFLERDRTFEEGKWRVEHQDLEVFEWWDTILRALRKERPHLPDGVPEITRQDCRILLLENPSAKLAKTPEDVVTYTLWLRAPSEKEPNHTVAVDATMKKTKDSWQVLSLRPNPRREQEARQTRYLEGMELYGNHDFHGSFPLQYRMAWALQDARTVRMDVCAKAFFEVDEHDRTGLGTKTACSVLAGRGPYLYQERSYMSADPPDAQDEKPQPGARQKLVSEPDVDCSHWWTQNRYRCGAIVEDAKTGHVEEYEYVVEDDGKRSQILSVKKNADFDGKNWLLDKQFGEVSEFWRDLLKQPAETRKKALQGFPGAAREWDGVDCELIGSDVARKDGNTVRFAVELIRYDKEQSGKADRGKDREYVFLIATMKKKGGTWEVAEVSIDTKAQKLYEESIKAVAFGQELMDATPEELTKLVMEHTDRVLDLLKRWKGTGLFYDPVKPQKEVDRFFPFDLDLKGVGELCDDKRVVAPLLKLLAKDVRGPQVSPREVPAVQMLSLLGVPVREAVLAKFMELSEKDKNYRILEKYCVQILLDIEPDSAERIPQEIEDQRGDYAKIERFKELAEELRIKEAVPVVPPEKSVR